MRVDALLLFFFACTHSVYANQFDTCVNVAGIYKFYHETERFQDHAADEVRKLLEAQFPDLTRLRCCLLPRDAAAHNQTMFARLKDGAAKIDAPTVSEATGQKILDEINTNPVTDLQNVSRYDRDGDVGFCFGRAYAVHSAAVNKYDVQEGSLRKIFVMGNFHARGLGNWKFHTAVIVRADNAEGWLVLDPIVGKPVTPKRWLEIFTKERAAEENNSPAIFVTKPEQLVPDPGATLADLLREPRIGPYFRDLFKYYPPPPSLR